MGLQTLWDKGLVYEGFRVVPYSWAAQTPLSNFETRLDNSYRERAGPGADRRASRSTPRAGEPAAQAPRLDDDALDAAVQPGARGHPDATMRSLEKGGERWSSPTRARRALRSASSDGFMQVDAVKGADARRPDLRAAVPVLRRHANAFRVLAGEFIEPARAPASSTSRRPSARTT